MSVRSTLADLLRAGRPRGTTSVAVVAAHPDDETIGMGGHLSSLPRATLVYLTDGAPRDGRDARDRGFSTPTEYAKARRRELEQALAIAGVPLGRCVHLGVADQEAPLHLADLTLELAHFFAAGKPDWVLTHAYEGGHPDHDAAAFVVHAAATLVRHRGSEPPALLEFASYHVREGAMEVGTFLPPPPELAGAEDVTSFELNEEQKRIKAEMLACYETQRHVLSAFPLDRESFRPAPAYDFRAPPHPGPLYYEGFPWGYTSTRWLELAAEAATRLRLAGE